MLGQDTALGNALRKVGFLPRQMSAHSTCVNFIKEGGTREEWLAIFDACQSKLRGVGLSTDGAGRAQRSRAKATQTNGGGESEASLSGQDRFDLDSSPFTKASRGGPVTSAKLGHVTFANPTREPTQSQIAAVAAAKRASAQSVFERELTHTGRQWGNVSYGELDSMAEDGDIAGALKKHIGSLRGNERHKLIKELMTTREFAQLINKVRKHAA